MAEKTNEDLLIALAEGADKVASSAFFPGLGDAVARGRELLAAREPKLMTAWDAYHIRFRAEHGYRPGFYGSVEVESMQAVLVAYDASVRAVLLHRITTEQPHSHPGKEQERIVAIINEVLTNG